jgi:hypothetical protein
MTRSPTIGTTTSGLFQIARSDIASTVSTLPSGPSRPPERMTTFAQYLEPVDVAMREHHGLRKGQTFFDILREMEPELADRLTGTADDPFYNGGKLAGFLLRVGEALR